MSFHQPTALSLIGKIQPLQSIFFCYYIIMLLRLFKELDTLVAEANRERDEEGLPRLGRSEFRVVGQMALWEQNVGLDLAATHDVDLFFTGSHWVQRRFEELLARAKLVLDDQSELIWMPEDTAYETLYEGPWVTAKVAQPEYVMISKARMAPRKNRTLLVEYLAKGASDLFFELAEAHGLDLEALVRDDDR